MHDELVTQAGAWIGSHICATIAIVLSRVARLGLSLLQPDGFPAAWLVIALQVRLLMSATNSARAWELRCRGREAMVSYLQREWPQHLPSRRLNGQPEDALAGPAALSPRAGGGA